MSARRLPHAHATRAAALLGALFCASLSAPALAQVVVAPNDPKLEPKAPSPKAKAESEVRVGAQFVDNPDWLEAELKAETPAKSDEPAPDELEEPGYLPGYAKPYGVGLSAHVPQVSSPVPGGITPAFGAPKASDELRFDFHGYIQAGLRAGIGQRDDALDGQKKTTLHADPLIAGGTFGWFDHSNTMPTPWGQLTFSLGNDTVRATAIIGAWSFGEADEASGYFQAPSKVWFNDAYLTFTPDTGPVGLRFDIGVFPDRYGAMAEYDLGAYGAPLIAAIYGIGATGNVRLPFDNDVTITVEGGAKGDMNQAPIEIIPDQSNEFARSVEGSTYAAHGHVSFDFAERIEVAGHAIHSFSQDDRPDALNGRDRYLGDEPRRDGSIDIFGADLRLKAKRFGYFYVGGSHVVGKDAVSVSNLVQVLNSGGGKELMERYWGFESGGNGTLTLVGGQYALSLGTLLRHPAEFWGDAPDLIWKTFGIYGSTTSDAAPFDDQRMLKLGSELTYSMLSWLAVSGRVDRVSPNLTDNRESFTVLSPKLIFRNDWKTQASLTLQYAAYLLGSDVKVNGDNRLVNNPSGQPDPHFFALYGTMWW
jgi:hypothetical protein